VSLQGLQVPSWTEAVGLPALRGDVEVDIDQTVADAHEQQGHKQHRIGRVRRETREQEQTHGPIEIRHYRNEDQE